MDQEYQYYDQQDYYHPDEEEYYVPVYDSYSQEKCQDHFGQTYEVLPQSALLNHVLQLANRLRDLIGIPMGWCIILLNEFKWNYEILTDKFFQNPEKYKKLIHYQESFKDPNEIKLDQSGVCDVCCSQGKLIQYICGDKFCYDCWGSHLIGKINEGVIVSKCMGCEVPMLYESIIKILEVMPVQNKPHKLIQRYKKLLCQMFSTINHSYQCCLGVDCNNCIKSDTLTITTVKCTCGKSFCFHCKSDDHTPCSCEQKKKWTDLVMKQQADAKWMAVNTKMCPSCSKPVQRSAGCNFMACTCGKNFCYMCSKPWQPDHKDHFKCHIYNKRNDDSANKQKSILEKINFYAQHYLNNQACSDHLKKIDTFDQRKFLFEILQIDLTESEFIDQAYKFAIECCDCLKWIYAYVYFIKFPSQLAKQAFDYSQADFERYKQGLMKKLSYDLKGFVEKLREKVQKIKQGQKVVIDKQSEIDHFKKLKKSIINYYTSTKVFKDKFVREIENLDVKLVDKPFKSSSKKSQKPPAKEPRMQLRSNVTLKNKKN